MMVAYARERDMVVLPARRPEGALWRWLSGGGPIELIRFAGVGGLSTAVHTLLFGVLADSPSLVANLVASVVSTALGTEMHRRVTFRNGVSVNWWTAQWESGSLAAVGLVVSSAVLGLVGIAAPGTAWWQQALLVNAASLVIGLVRYLALRGWVFRAR